MKLITVIGAGALAVSVCDWANAAHPPLDRPTPPPCCADGICYPNPHTYGWYATRWRRWPTDTLQPVPAVPTPMDKLAPDIKPYDAPPAEQEDRRAPPPTTPRAEAEAEAVETPETTPVVPPSEGGVETPPSGPAIPGPAVPPTRMPWENGGEPTGDLDPPPTLPTTSTAATAHRTIVPHTGHPRTGIGLESAPSKSATVRPRTAPASDPPPLLPVTLASATY